MEPSKKLFSERKYIGSGEDALPPYDFYDSLEDEQLEDEECLENIE